MMVQHLIFLVNRFRQTPENYHEVPQKTKKNILFHTVVAVFWASVSRRLAVEETRFRMRIILGVVLIRSLVII